MIFEVLAAAAVAVAPPVRAEPIFLHCWGHVMGGEQNATASHDVVIDGPRGWIDGKRYNVDFWEGRQFYRLRGPITAPDAAPEPQITFDINRRTGDYTALTTHTVLEITMGADVIMGMGCAVAKPRF